MSAKYEQGIWPKWFMQTVTIHTSTTRDAYGRVTATSTVDAPAKVEPKPIELIEAGTRTKRNGVRITVAAASGVSIDIGTIIAYGSERYSVIGVLTRPDHQGFNHFFVCDCVTKTADKAI